MRHNVFETHRLVISNHSLVISNHSLVISNHIRFLKYIKNPKYKCLQNNRRHVPIVVFLSFFRSKLSQWRTLFSSDNCCKMYRKQAKSGQLCVFTKSVFYLKLRNTHENWNKVTQEYTIHFAINSVPIIPRTQIQPINTGRIRLIM